MADLKTSQLTQLSAAPDVADLLMLVDVSDTTMAASGTNKKLPGAYVARSNADGTLITGNGRVLTVPATGTAALVSAGTWQPVLSFGSGTTGIAYSVQSGQYTLIGTLCLVVGWFTLSSKGSSTGAARIGNLPFTVANVANMYPIASIQWINMATGLVTMAGIINFNTTFMDVNGLSAANGTLSQLTDTAFANNSQLRFSALYQIA